MHRFTILLAGLVLVLAGCAEDDRSPADQTGSPDAFSPSPSVSATMSPPGSPSPTDLASPTDAEIASPFGSPTDSPEESPDVDDSPGASPTESPGTGFGAGDCEEAFAAVPDLDSLSGLGDLTDALSALDETIEACESVEEWSEQAGDVLGSATLLSDAGDFLESRCEDSDVLAETDICQEL